MANVVLILVLFLATAQLALADDSKCFETVFQTPKLRSYITEATKNLTRDVLKSYLFGNEEAMGRFGGKLEKMAEKLLQKELDSLDYKLGPEQKLESFLTTLVPNSQPDSAEREGTNCDDKETSKLPDSSDSTVKLKPEVLQGEGSEVQEQTVTPGYMRSEEDEHFASTGRESVRSQNPEEMDTSGMEPKKRGERMTTEMSLTESVSTDEAPTERCSNPKEQITEKRKIKQRESKIWKVFLPKTKDLDMDDDEEADLIADANLKFDLLRRTLQDLGVKLLKTIKTLEPQLRPLTEKPNSTTAEERKCNSD